MNKKTLIGLVGVLVGGFWLLDAYQGFSREGVAAAGIPAIIFLLGLNFLIKGLRGER